MFYHNISIDDVFHVFKIKDDFLFFLKKRGGVCKYLLNSKRTEWEVITEKLYSLVMYKNYLIADNSEHNQYLLDSSQGQLNTIPLNFPKSWKNKLIANKYLFATYTDKKKEVALYNLESLSYEWKVDRKLSNEFHFDELNNLGFYIERGQKSIISTIHLSNGKDIWKKDISSSETEVKQEEVKKFLGVYDDIFWVAITNHKVIGLDVNTGAIKHELRDIPDFKSVWLPSTIPDPYGMQMDKMNGKIVGFRWEFYWEIDLKQEKPEIKLYDLTNYFKELKLRSTLADYVLTDEYIYFSEFEKGKIGAFNRQTLKVDWLHRMEHIKDDSLDLIIRKIDYRNNRLFVLDSEGTLHVFEME